MAGSTYSTNLKIELMTTGENSGTWGDITNTNLGTALEQAIVGFGTVDFIADANLTISITNSNSSQAARCLVLNVTSGFGSLSTTRELVVPTIQKQYIVQNNTTGGQSITVKTSAGTGITVPNGRKAHLYVDGTNVISMFNYVGTLYVDTLNATALNATTIDLTNLEVTNIKAKDGTAAMSIADITGVVSLTANPVLSGGTANGILYLNGSKSATSGSALTFDGNGQVISVNSSTNALRITQTGSGNALLVEDSTNPDSTPVVINASGQTIFGHTTAISTYQHPQSAINFTPSTQIQGSNVGATLAATAWSNVAATSFYAPAFYLAKSASATVGTQAAVVSGEVLGTINFSGDDGTAFVKAAQITASVDGTPGTNDMPGRLVFATTADGSATPTERMRIASNGVIAFNSTVTAGGASGQFRFGGNITGAVSSAGVLYTPTVQSDVTNTAAAFQSSISTQDAAFTLTSLVHYQAVQGTITGGSRTAPTNQIGFQVNSSLTGATNNFGFRSEINAGTGRWNFYAGGTAENYFAGNTVINVTDNTNAALRITQLGTGNALLVEDSANPDATPFVIDASGNTIIGSTATESLLNPVNGLPSANSFQIVGTTFPATSAGILRSSATAAGPFLIFAQSRGSVSAKTISLSGDASGSISFQGYDGTNFLQTASISSAVDGTPGTNDMPGRLVFSTTASGASTPTERMRIDNVGRFGYNGAPLVNAGHSSSFSNLSGTGIYGDIVYVTAQSGTTSSAQGYTTSLNTAAAAFTLSSMQHFLAIQGTLGAGSAITTQAGFVASASLTGATTNYGFQSGIAAGTGRWNFYANGTAANWFSGDVLVFGAGGLGYTTGSGGAVTQATSRTTGVTLNKTNGAITLVSAAGSATYQSFTVTNSTVAATDTIIVNQKSGTDLYEIMVTNVAAGSFRLTYRTTGGTTTEQPVFNFAVIKAVTA